MKSNKGINIRVSQRKAYKTITPIKGRREMKELQTLEHEKDTSTFLKKSIPNHPPNNR